MFTSGAAPERSTGGVTTPVTSQRAFITTHGGRSRARTDTWERRPMVGQQIVNLPGLGPLDASSILAASALGPMGQMDVRRILTPLQAGSLPARLVTIFISLKVRILYRPRAPARTGMGRTFNPYAERVRSTEFDSRGARIRIISQIRWPRRLEAVCRRRGAGVPASLSARRSRVRPPPVASRAGARAVSYARL